MSEVFISYAREDCEAATVIADQLAQQGWSVFWDRTIRPGQVWDDVLEEALNSARCVIVLWSAVSVQSQWVRAEASEAHDRRVLVPAVLEEVAPPLRFRQVHAADLTLRPLEESSGLRDLIDAVRQCLGTERAVTSASSTVDAAERREQPWTVHDLPERGARVYRLPCGAISGASTWMYELLEDARAAISNESGPRRIVLNLREVTVTDSPGIGVILAIFTSARKAGRTLALAELSSQVLRDLTISVGDLIPTYQTESEAVDA